MSGMLERLRGLDAFPKAAEEFRVRTHAGGLVSLVGVAVMVVLLLVEAGGFFWGVEAEEEVVIDRALDEVLSIHFDITFPKMACEHLAVETVDASGGAHHGSEHDVFELPLNEEGLVFADPVQYGHNEDATVLSMSEYSHLQAAGKNKDKSKTKNREAAAPKAPVSSGSSCGSCYTPMPLASSRMMENAKDNGKRRENKQCCETCAQVRDAFLARGWAWRKDGEHRFWQCNKRVRGPPKPPTIQHAGCEVVGSLRVPKAKGSFHFGPSAHIMQQDLFQAFWGRAGGGGGREGHTSIDMSHKIHALWFGDTAPEEAQRALSKVVSSAKAAAPALQGSERTVERGSLVHYYLKIVATDISLDGRKSNGTLQTHQYAVSEHVRPATQTMMPSLHFFYDTPPLRLQYSAKRKSWAHFFTRLSALIGGTYTLMGLVDRALHTRSGRAISSSSSSSSSSSLR